MEDEIIRLQQLANERQSLKNIIKVFTHAEQIGVITIDFKSYGDIGDIMGRDCVEAFKINEMDTTRIYKNLFDSMLFERLNTIEAEIKEIGNSL